MVILSSAQIHDWDAYTIRQKPIRSIDLMEIASTRCVQWLWQRTLPHQPIAVFCGKGNNGGDGLAIGRLLSARGRKVAVYILEAGQKGTDDFQENLAGLHQTPAEIVYLQSPDHFPVLSAGTMIVDALFGTGLNRKLEGLAAALVEKINSYGAEVVSIDMPSGMLADGSSRGFPVITATHTLSFQCMKLAFMLPENEAHTGVVHILEIGLMPGFLAQLQCDTLLLDIDLVRAIYKPRKRFSHKGNYGHALLIAGSKGMMGAAVLAARACLRSGVGKLSCLSPECGYSIMQTAVPEAMCSTNGDDYLTAPPGHLEQYAAIGIGPGMGTRDEQAVLIKELLSGYKHPLLADADALNLLAKQPDLLSQLPAFSIITPHPAEFDRLFGPQSNDFERIEAARKAAARMGIIIILKGHHTLIAMPGGNAFFNSTGNPGMATGGSGDVLSGIITGLLAQQYAPEQAALLGVFLHGLAGDCAAKRMSEEAMIAGDIVDHLGEAFLRLVNHPTP